MLKQMKFALVMGLFAIAFSGLVSIGHAGETRTNSQIEAQIKSDYQKLAVKAAKAAFEVTWSDDPGLADIEYKIVSEKISNDDVHVTGVYKVQVMMKSADGSLVDRGMDVKVEIYDFAVLKMEVVCRTCG